VSSDSVSSSRNTRRIDLGYLYTDERSSVLIDFSCQQASILAGFFSEIRNETAKGSYAAKLGTKILLPVFIKKVLTSSTRAYKKSDSPGRGAAKMAYWKRLSVMSVFGVLFDGHLWVFTDDLVGCFRQHLHEIGNRIESFDNADVCVFHKQRAEYDGLF
jgi:hypothetical protein